MYTYTYIFSCYGNQEHSKL